jgi:hypothetical protein
MRPAQTATPPDAPNLSGWRRGAASRARGSGTVYPVGVSVIADSSSSLSPSSVARLLIDALVAQGVDTYFGIPGGPVCPVFEAIRLHPKARLIE